MATLARTKIPLRLEQIPNRQILAVQSALRQASSTVNGHLQVFPADEYADEGTWDDALTTTASATFIDSSETLTLTDPVAAGDVLEIVGRAHVGTDVGAVGAVQLIVYEGGQRIATPKKATYYQVPANTPLVQVSFVARHDITVAGVCRVALQLMLASGSGNVYLFPRGAMLVRVGRP